MNRTILARVSTRPRLGTALLLLAATLSCQSTTFSSPYWEAVQAELNRQYNLWLAAAPAHYEYRFHRQCACDTNLTREVIVEVRDTTLITVTYTDGSGAVPASSFESYFTVKGLFQQVQHAINLLADSLVVQYDPVMHYPRVILGDPNQLLDGDELGLFADSLVAK